MSHTLYTCAVRYVSHPFSSSVFFSSSIRFLWATKDQTSTKIHTFVLKDGLNAINPEVNSSPSQAKLQIQQRVNFNPQPTRKRRIPQRPAMRSQGQIPSAWPSGLIIGILKSKSFQGQLTCQLRMQKGYLGLQCRANLWPQDLTRTQSCNQLPKMKSPRSYLDTYLQWTKLQPSTSELARNSLEAKPAMN